MPRALMSPVEAGTTTFGDLSFYKSSRTPARMISDSLEVENQMGTESTKAAHARFEPGPLKTLQKF